MAEAPPTLPRTLGQEGTALKRTIHLASVDIHRFGGIHRYGRPGDPPPDFHFDFEKPLTLIQGDNGAGKTSLLSAITWCLGEHAEHVFVLWLPTYSPELNAIEGLWGYLKRTATNNYFFGNTETLEKALHQAFAELNQHPETTLSLAYNTSKKLGETA